MKKTFLATLIAALMVVGIVGAVSAQGPDPECPGNNCETRGLMMGTNNTGETTAPMHDSMMSILEEKLDLSVDEINALLAEGKTMVDLFSAAGLSPEDFSAAMTEARQAALDTAVSNGILSQEQAEWMSQRQQGRIGQGTCVDGTPDPQNQSFRRGGRWATQ